MIRVTGADDGELDPQALERAIRTHLTGDPDPNRPVCTAASALLVFDPDGRVAPCEFASRKVDWPAGENPWTLDPLVALRKAHAGNQLPTDFCGGCVRRLRESQAARCPIVRDYAAVPVSDRRGARVLVARVSKSSDVLTRVAKLLVDEPEAVVVEGSAPFDAPGFDALIAAIAALEERLRPELEIRAVRWPDAEAARQRLGDVRVHRARVAWSVDLDRQLGRALKIVDDPVDAAVAYEFGATTWARTHEAATAAAAHGVACELRVAHDLTRIPLREQQFAVNELARDFERLSGDDRPASLTEIAYTDLLSDVRDAVRAHAEPAIRSAPKRLLEGQNRGLAWPDLDEPLLSDATLAEEFCARALELEATPSLCAWVEHTAETHDALPAHLLERPWLRVLLQSVVCHGRNEVAAQLLRETYARDKQRRGLLTAETELAARHGVSERVAGFHESLGLHRWKQRRAPFSIKGARPVPDPFEPDVTVLVPSYRHADYIVATMESVLAQTYGNFKLLVVDDVSPDDTVERAQSLEDPRIEVRVNRKNLGLGTSVLTALEQCDTPFVALLNSDDLFHPDRLEQCRAALLANESAQVVATGLHIVDAENGRLTPTNTSRLRDGEEVFDWTGWYSNAMPSEVDPNDCFAELLSANFLATSSNLFCRTEFLRAQAKELQQLKYCLDWHVFLEAARTASLVYLPERLASYRLHAANTVWFREGRRWSYYLEVNRVVATMLEKFAATDDHDEDVLRLLVERVVDNTEVDGFALYVNQLLGGAGLERLSETDETVELLVQRLSARTEIMTRVFYALREHGTDGVNFADLRDVPSLRVSRILSELHSEELASLRGANAWLNEEQNDLKRELGALRFDLRRNAERTEQELEHVSELLTKLSRGLSAVDDEFDGVPPSGEHDDVLTRFQSELSRLYELEWRINRQFEIVSHLESERARLETNLAYAWDQHGESQKQLFEARGERDGLRGELDHERETRERTEEELADERHRRARLQGEHQGLTEAHAWLTGEHERVTGELEGARRDIDELREFRIQLQTELRETVTKLAATRAAWRAELEELYGTREWRTGRFIWQKLPLMRKATRFGGKVRRKARDFWQRTKLKWRERKRGPAPHIVACATSSFPNYSHTFVYQELMSLHEHLGADITLLYRQDSDAANLPPAFGYLHERKTRIEASPEVSERDLQHFRQTRGDRVDSLFAALERVSGRSRDELEGMHELQSAFTFARHIEVLKPDYIHTYFFYDQSLNGLVASWLLDIPRGVSAYADHMMDDWPLKVVPLHLENASVVVATSRRIKEELCSIGGAQHADKIIVKPNGVDGRRFPYQERQPMPDGILELVSISRVEPKKGLVEVVPAIEILRERGRRVRVHIVGSVDPPTPENLAYADELYRAIDQRGLDDSFVHHGFKTQDEIRPLLSTAHGFLAPYVETESGDKDGIPTAMLEAMASGIPVVATDAGSITEVIDDGVEGFLAPQHDAHAMADAIEKLFCGIDELRHLGGAARARFEREFDTAITEARLHERVRALATGAKDAT